MKKLRIIGLDGVVICEILVNVFGKDFNFKANLPLLLPVIEVSLTELTEEETDAVGNALVGIE